MMMAPVRPNILFIMADQFRADALGCVGGWVKTPHLDALAHAGCLFRQAYANSVECIPSRLSLATGLYPHQFGVDTNRHCQLAPGAWTWMKALRDAGYTTALVGKTHLHPHEGDIRDRLHLMHAYGLQRVDETVGPRAAAVVRSNMSDQWEKAGVWDSYSADVKARFADRPHLARPTPLPLDLYYDRYVGDSGAAMLRDLPAGQPWFCWVSFGGPHEPWDAPEPYASLYDAQRMPPPRPPLDQWEDSAGLVAAAHRSAANRPVMTLAEIAEMRANYAGNVTLIDDEVGKIIRTLEARGEERNTLIIFTSDHGELNGDYGLVYKSNFLDPAARVPLIARPPVSTGPLRGSHDGLVSLVDLGQTILDYAGITDATSACGRSLRPMIEDDGDDRDYVVTEFGGHACLVTAGHKAEFDASGQLCSLTDRRRDSEERINLAGSGSAAALIAEIGQRYSTFLEETPFISGVVE